MIKITLTGIPTNLIVPFADSWSVEEISAYFLRDTTERIRKFHLVNWGVVTFPKKWEGFGMKDLGSSTKPC